MSWEILTNTIADGWINTWTITEPGQPERPQTFTTREEAEQALADYLDEGRLAAEVGDIAEAPHPNDHLVSRVEYIETVQIEWQGILIEVRYAPYWLGSSDDGDACSVAHLELESLRPERAPLPVTGTGYRSHFTSCAEVEANGGAASFVQHWLDHEAKSSAWKAQAVPSRQMSLF
ncbi:hypothetical protein [Parerythrobacter lacustris]|uniref:Uncharacterized protein n=1 Tax=Parerythrobacter lacustris TaxID=2969984 RepID=A0ABT1XL68_9SPHN|nr:hypothetical protein [Parerythrobacter lacustris]MCR2832404.1 hypothetical protein [Parerythrobacter lacustris]